MTKAEEFDKARRLAYKGDFSLVEKLYHPDCKHFDHRVGLEVNLDMQSALMTHLKTQLLVHFGLSMKMKIFFYAYNAISEMKVLKVTLFGHRFQASII